MNRLNAEKRTHQPPSAARPDNIFRAPDLAGSDLVVLLDEESHISCMRCIVFVSCLVVVEETWLNHQMICFVVSFY